MLISLFPKRMLVELYELTRWLLNRIFLMWSVMTLWNATSLNSLSPSFYLWLLDEDSKTPIGYIYHLNYAPAFSPCSSTKKQHIIFLLSGVCIQISLFPNLVRSSRFLYLCCTAALSSFKRADFKRYTKRDLDRRDNHP